MNMKVNTIIDSYYDQFAAMLARWVKVPSVKGEPEDGAPFGTEVKRMLDMAMVDAETMGFMTHVYDGYACDVTLGSEKREMIAMLGHLDVVPAGDGWQVPPFGAVMEGDKMYGRGTMDDKGPTLAALFAMKAIKEAKIPLKKSIRLIMGCDEESGWEDMEYYQEHADMPEVGFSPDASFPIINTEKAMLGFSLKAKVYDSGLKVLAIDAGQRTNVIPGEAKALVAGGQEILDAVKTYAEQTGLPYTAEANEQGVVVTALGIPGHSAYPEGRRNAIGMLLKLLKYLGVEGPIAILADKVGMESDGTSLGVACEDEVSGHLTNNIGILKVKNDIMTATLDYRVPVKADLEKLTEITMNSLQGIKVIRTKKTEPHHVPGDSELVSNLLAAYHEETGLPAHVQSTGGGTYAKCLKQGVAFGASFPDDEDLAHQAGEYAYISKLLTAAKVYANALIRLCGA